MVNRGAVGRSDIIVVVNVAVDSARAPLRGLHEGFWLAAAAEPTLAGALKHSQVPLRLLRRQVQAAESPAAAHSHPHR